MIVFDQLQRALSAEGINCSLVHILFSVRIHEDTAHLAIQQASSETEARQWMETEGKLFREPVAVLRNQSDPRPVQLPPPNVIESSESIAGIGDAANIWRGYGKNTRGVIKFRRGRFVGEVNAPSVEDATVVAKGLVLLLTP